MKGVRGMARQGRKVVAWLALALALGALSTPARAADLPAAERAIVQLDVERAAQLLEGARGPEASYLRALLAVYRADCDGALALLASPALREKSEAASLHDLARRCTAATVGGVVVDDVKRGVWLRFQDEADRVLAPLLAESAARARETLEKDLGVDLPRPLRIDVVRDLFSLSAVSGLPLEAAETTGTVAVARWGRVTFVSPRATQRGYAWQDTLAHEITHLLLSRGSADQAPLWLQEGIAKREETRWRAPRVFDKEPSPDRVAFDALRQGKSVGIDQLGPSIAMLPSPEAASIAFAEVTSFMGYWIEVNGPLALPLLLADLKVTHDAESAMRSVSGYGISEWKIRWHAWLTERFKETTSEASTASPLAAGGASTPEPREVARWLRLGELLSNAGRSKALLSLLEADLEVAPQVAPLRWQLGRAAWLDGRSDASKLLGDVRDVDSVHGAWLALRGRWALGSEETSHSGGESVPGSAPVPERTAEELWEHAVALDPLFVDVACEGYPKELPLPSVEPPLPNDPARRALCEHVRSLPVRGSE
jgi:hypothetical protein